MLKLSKKDILDYQQNRDPYLMIDEATSVIPGKSAKGYKDFNEVLSKITNNNEGHAQFSDQDSNVLFYGVTVEEFSIGDFILI